MRKALRQFQYHYVKKNTKDNLHCCLTSIKSVQMSHYLQNNENLHQLIHVLCSSLES